MIRQFIAYIPIDITGHAYSVRFNRDTHDSRGYSWEL